MITELKVGMPVLYYNGNTFYEKFYGTITEIFMSYAPQIAWIETIDETGRKTTFAGWIDKIRPLTKTELIEYTLLKLANKPCLIRREKGT